MLGSMNVIKKGASGIVHRYPSGKKKQPAPTQPRTRWRRLSDNKDAMLKMGGHADWGHKLGFYLSQEVISQKEYHAGQIYGRIAGRYRKYHADCDLPLTAASPNYQRSSRGSDDELHRRELLGTMKDYEKDAKSALKAWKKLQGCIPNDVVRTVVEEVCIFDREIAQSDYTTLKDVLNAVANRFGARVSTRSARY